MSAPTWPEVLGSLIGRADLTADQTAWAMGQILAGEASPAQIAGFAVALRAKGETIEEMEGLVAAMYAAATPLSVEGRVLDVVGTGGDRSFSVNISTMAAIVAAGAGVTVVKHGNRSASSKAGSADVLEQLGIRLDLPADDVARVAGEAGITFCFAAAFHPALRHAASARSDLGVGTSFNFLGPIANPARPAAQAIGCADRCDGPRDGGGVRPAWRRRLGVPRRRRPRRADHDHHLERVGGQWRRGVRAHRRSRFARHPAGDRRGAEGSRCGVQRRGRTPPPGR